MVQIRNVLNILWRPQSDRQTLVVRRFAVAFLSPMQRKGKEKINEIENKKAFQIMLLIESLLDICAINRHIDFEYGIE